MKTLFLLSLISLLAIFSVPVFAQGELVRVVLLNNNEFEGELIFFNNKYLIISINDIPLDNSNAVNISDVLKVGSDSIRNISYRKGNNIWEAMITGAAAGGALGLLSFTAIDTLSWEKIGGCLALGVAGAVVGTIGGFFYGLFTISGREYFLPDHNHILPSMSYLARFKDREPVLK